MTTQNSNHTNFYEVTDSIRISEFLLWLKKRTEADWEVHTTISFETFQKSGCRSGTDWKQGTKWLEDFTESDIHKAEQYWRRKFPPDYRHFLLMLGAPDQDLFGVKCVDGELVCKDVPFFYNWCTDKKYLEQALKWPLEVLLSDTEQGKWYESWGTRPKTLEKRRELVRKLVAAAPPLIPLTTRKSYLVGTPVQMGNPIISIDIPIYQDESVIDISANNLKNFLLLELSEFLNINRRRAWEQATSNVDKNFVEKIPFWGEIILPLWED